MREQTDSNAVPDGAARPAAAVLARLELPDAANELLAIVGYITGADGPLQQPADPDVPALWHDRMLRKAMERLEVIDAHLRGRVAFFVAGRDGGYGSFEGELELAGAALDTCRAVTLVAEALLEGRLPTERQFAVMSDAVLRIYPALAAI